MSPQLFFVCLVWAFALVQHGGAAEEWCYEDPKCGPNTWGGECQYGSMQSPINLNYNSRVRPRAADLYQSDEYFRRQNFFIVNNGHTVQVALSPDLTSTAAVQGSMVRGKPYTFSQLHFHWGDRDSQGSEHTINRRAFPMEVHLVHYRSDFDNLKQAIDSNETDALAVIGTVFDFYGDNFDNEALTPILRTFSTMERSANRNATGTDLNLSWFFPQSDYQEVRAMQYEGSLTTPGCAQVVLWNMFIKPAPISQRQMDLFRSLKNAHTGKALVNNFRPIQQNNYRTIETIRAAVTQRR